MKKLIIAAALSLGIITAINAQDREHKDKTPEERAKMMTEGLQKRLDLSKDQEAKVYQKYLQRANKMNEAKKEGKMDREKMKADNDAFDNDLQNILTADQKAKYKEMKSKMGKNRKGGHGREGGEKKKAEEN